MFGKSKNLLSNYNKIAFVFLFLFCFNSSLKSNEDEEDKSPFYKISSCSRGFSVTSEYKLKKSHCFIKLSSKDDREIETAGFFQEGVAQEEDIKQRNTSNEKCEIEKFNATLDHWKKIREVYDQHGADNYHVTECNCCTVATKALEALGIKSTHLHKVNFGIGTKVFPVKTSTQVYKKLEERHVRNNRFETDEYSNFFTNYW